MTVRIRMEAVHHLRVNLRAISYFASLHSILFFYYHYYYYWFCFSVSASSPPSSSPPIFLRFQMGKIQNTANVHKGSNSSSSASKMTAIWCVCFEFKISVPVAVGVCNDQKVIIFQTAGDLSLPYYTFTYNNSWRDKVHPFSSVTVGIVGCVLYTVYSTMWLYNQYTSWNEWNEIQKIGWECSIFPPETNHNGYYLNFSPHHLCSKQTKKKKSLHSINRYNKQIWKCLLPSKICFDFFFLIPPLFRSICTPNSIQCDSDSIQICI